FRSRSASGAVTDPESLTSQMHVRQLCVPTAVLKMKRASDATGDSPPLTGTPHVPAKTARDERSTAMTASIAGGEMCSTTRTCRAESIGSRAKEQANIDH